jgi:uncharacterized membrane protein YcaP (DUF421 family)
MDVSSALLGYGAIVLSTACVYLFIVIAMRLFGKTEVAQLSIIDLVFVMLLSNAVQNAMVGSDTSLAGGLVAAATLFVMDGLFKKCLYRIPWFSRFLQGDPVILIQKGQEQQRNMRRALISHDELMEALREHGVEDEGQVDYAVLEVDGNISVLSQQFRTKTSRRSRSPKRVSRKQQG